MPVYPAELEAWWLEEARRFTRSGDDRTATLRLASAAEVLSNLFTTERAAHFGDYGRRPELLRAYGLYAFPQTFVRTQFVLEELRALHRLAIPRQVLDLGCGTGAASAAIRHFFPEVPLHFDLVDQSAESLQLAESLLMKLWPDTIRQTHRDHARNWPGRGPFDLIICSFALNELFYGRPLAAVTEWVEQAFTRLAPEGWLILLEPALQETAGRLMELRDHLAASGRWQIAAPCPHIRPCPLRAEGKYWCHEVRNWPLPSSLQRLNSQLGRSIHELKFSFLVIRPQMESLSPTPGRLVAPMSRLKGRWATRICAPEGNLINVSLSKSKIDETVRARLKSIERGDRLGLNESAIPIFPPPPESFRNEGE